MKTRQKLDKCLVPNESIPTGNFFTVFVQNHFQESCSKAFLWVCPCVQWLWLLQRCDWVGIYLAAFPLTRCRRDPEPSWECMTCSVEKHRAEAQNLSLSKILGGSHLTGVCSLILFGGVFCKYLKELSCMSWSTVKCVCFLGNFQPHSWNGAD